MIYLELHVKLIVVFIHSDRHESLCEVSSKLIIFLFNITPKHQLPDIKRVKKSQIWVELSMTCYLAVPLDSPLSTASAADNFAVVGRLSRVENCSSTENSLASKDAAFLLLQVYITL